MAYERKQYVGNAAPSALSITIDSTDTNITIVDATNWPTGAANGKFVISIGRGTPTEEKILCSSRTGTSMTANVRGHDGTTAQTHTAGAMVEHVWDAESADQTNRYVNLQTVKGDLVVHNGINPVKLPTGAVDEGDNGKVLQTAFAEATGLIFGPVQTMVISAGAPPVDGAVRLWYDSTDRQMRPSDGATWLTPVQLPAFASAAARNSYFDTAPGNACYRSDLNFCEYFNGLNWQPLGRAVFANAGARDAYYLGPPDGAQAYLLGTHVEQIYRNGEWIDISQKVTVSASAPASPNPGDIWLEPIA